MTTLPAGLPGLNSFPPVTVVPPASLPELQAKVGAGEGRGGNSPSLLPPKPRNARYQSLDMWRGAACLMLLLYHATFYADLTFRITEPASWSLAGLPLSVVRKLWIGVPIFFVISGYCISASIDSLRRRPHSLWDYFVRRVRRIYPPLWVMCVIAVLFSGLMATIPAVSEHCRQLPKLSTFSIWSWLGNFAAAEAWLPNLAGGDSHYLMANTWTLCYEEQFYLVTGIMLAFASRRFFVAAAVTTAAVLAIRHTLRLCGVSHEGFFWDGHWIMFATGILVYHALNYQTTRQRWRTFGVLGIGMIYGFADRVLSHDPVQKHLSEYVFVACLFGVAMILLRPWDEAIAKHWSMKPFTWCGQRSYSIYLTHFLLVVVVSSVLALCGLTSELAVATIVVPVCLLVSLPIASLFYRLIEQRFLNAPAS